MMPSTDAKRVSDFALPTDKYMLAESGQDKRFVSSISIVLGIASFIKAIPVKIRGS